MKNLLLDSVKMYLDIFPEEEIRQLDLINYLNLHNDKDVYNWNNFDGHVTVGGFIYSREFNKFLMLYHKDLNMYLYPGGHIDTSDGDMLSAVKREIREETGLINLEQLTICDNKLIPFDIDTHLIRYNKRLDLPEHFHFDFRYLFFVDKVENVDVDNTELENYKWISIDELRNDSNYSNVVMKLEKLLFEK